MSESLVGLLVTQRQRAQVILITPQLVARPTPRIGHIPKVSQKPFSQLRRSGCLTAFHRQQQRAPDHPLRVAGFVLGGLFRAPEIPEPPVYLGDAGISHGARRIGAGYLNVSLILADGLAGAALLEVDVTKVNYGRLEFRVERQGAVVLGHSSLVPSGLLIGHSQAVMRVGLTG